MWISKEERNEFNELFQELVTGNYSIKNINRKNEKGETILHRAAKVSTRKKISWLIRKGGDIEARDNEGYTPLHAAVFGRRLESVKELIEAGADVNATEEDGNTPLHLACMIGAKNIVKELIKARAEINPVSIKGFSPMHYAFDEEIREILEKKRRKNNKQTERDLEKNRGRIRG
ncbi:MAG: ankyrin repeat domain-containing protein [Wolbachia endosymbiont of Menacanthus eurysternus]|nr:ankyrin repeat domain-containing protein [Wolbachia endosymbiont of Menacanthus eurysternus]